MRVAGRLEEQAAKVVGDSVGLMLDLTPSNTDDAPPRNVQRAVARPVAFISRSRCMEPVAIELDHQVRCAPEAIDLKPGPAGPDARVHLRSRQARTIEEREKSPLQFASGEPDVAAVFSEQPPK